MKLSDEKMNKIIDIYEEYVSEALNIKDIDRWAVKKSITENLLTSERKNETKVLDALKGKQFRVGDKVYLYNKIDGEIQDSKQGELKYTKMLKKDYEKLGVAKQPKTPECTHADRSTCYKCNPDMYYPKMVPNKVLAVTEDFDGNYDKDHYKSRVYKTMEILKNVVDMDKILK